MRRTTRCVAAILLPLAAGLGLMSLLALNRPAAAGPVDVTPLPPPTVVDGFAGVCFANYYGPGNRPFLPLVHNAGARHDRVDFRWDVIAARGYAEGYDPLVTDELAAGVDLIGILWATPADFRKPGCNPAAARTPGGRPPGWYAPEFGAVGALETAASDPGACPPAGLYNPWTPENFNGNYWAEFVYRTAEHYRGQVRNWEIWNEAEWDWFWLGSDAEYAQLLKVGYQAVKTACPDCTVLFGGLHYWADPTFYERVLDILNDDPSATAHNYFFDAMSVHLYSRSSTIYDVISDIRSRMQLYVPDHPVWLTETGVPVYDGAYSCLRTDYSARETEAAAYLIQSYANALAAGVKRYHWFRVHDDNWAECFGLMHDEHSLRPAYVAYQVAATYLISPTFVTRVATGPHVRVSLWGTPRGKVSVLWNTSPTAGVYTLTAALPTAVLVDRVGATRTVAATGGLYTVALPGATAARLSDPTDYIIGGDPLIVIESETVNQPPTATVHPPPAIITTTAVTISWSGWDNESGVWLYDVQVRDGAGGAWSDWRRSTTATEGRFTGANNHTYYFRARATDRVGNRAPWPAAPQAQTTINLSATLRISITAFFADVNRNDVWDRTITGTGSLSRTREITLTGVTLRLLDAAGRDVVAPAVGDSWAAEVSVSPEADFRLWAAAGDYARGLQLRSPGAGEVYTVTYPALGLWPVTRIYLPLTLRGIY